VEYEAEYTAGLDSLIFPSPTEREDLRVPEVVQRPMVLLMSISGCCQRGQAPTGQDFRTPGAGSEQRKNFAGAGGRGALEPRA
jgi:hypothetical protein